MGGFRLNALGMGQHQETVEGNRRLDINQLNRAGCLRPGYSGGWEWKHDGERVAWIQFRRDGNTLVLSYRVRQHGEEWQDIEQPTPIVWMPCRFWWYAAVFCLPGYCQWIACGRRVAKLYGAGAYFLCRHCYRLAYATQREDRYDRACVEPIIFGCGLVRSGHRFAVPGSAKGMHHKTYEAPSIRGIECRNTGAGKARYRPGAAEA